tara:strand:- start:531 stop:947 length:417 start_codon:yes stop_codon:yes gene_type:complete
MANSNFNNIDSNQIATARQVFAVASHFARIQAKSPSEKYGLTKVFNAVLNKHYKDSDSFMTHSDVTEWFEWDCVPEQFSHMISTKKSKAKPKASKKVKAKASAEPKTTKAPKKSSTLTQRVDSLESKMDKILEILTAK